MLKVYEVAHGHDVVAVYVDSDAFCNRESPFTAFKYPLVGIGLDYYGSL